MSMWGKLLILLVTVFFTPLVRGTKENERTLASELTAEQVAAKTSLINELIEIENINKMLYSSEGDLNNFLKVIRGENASYCMERRCISKGQIKIKIDSEPQQPKLYLSFGAAEKDIIVDTGGNITNFEGILGNISSTMWADSCLNQSMSYLKIKNINRSLVTISALEMTLDAGNGVFKTIFKDNQEYNLERNEEVFFSIEEIRSNQAYRAARIASCQD